MTSFRPPKRDQTIFFNHEGIEEIFQSLLTQQVHSFFRGVSRKRNKQLRNTWNSRAPANNIISTRQITFDYWNRILRNRGFS